MERVVQICISELEPDFREVLIFARTWRTSAKELSRSHGSARRHREKSPAHRARATLKSSVERKIGEKIR